MLRFQNSQPFTYELSESTLFIKIPRLIRHLRVAGIDFEEAKHWTSSNSFCRGILYSSKPFTRPRAIPYDIFIWHLVSFSKLNLIKNYLRSTMSQSHLSDLALLSIKNDAAKTVKFDQVIINFAALS